MNKVKKLVMILMLSPVTLSAQHDLTGIWRIREIKSIKGPQYANGVPVMMKIKQVGSTLTLEVTDLLGDHDSSYTQQLKTGRDHVNEIQTALGKKKRIIIYWDTAKNVWVRESIIFDKQHSDKQERQIKEDIQAQGDVLTLFKNSELLDGEDNDQDYTMSGTYDKVKPEELILETAKGRGIQFAKDLTWEQIKAKAKKENKLIFVDCYATWCGPCKVMDREVFLLNMVGDAMKDKFIAVKVQMDSTKNDPPEVKLLYPVARELERTYAISALPTYLFFASDGRPLHKTTGQQKPRDFIKLVQIAHSKPDDQLYTLVRKARNKQIPYVEFPALARRLREEFDEKELGLEVAKQYKEQYLDKLSEDQLQQKESWTFFNSYASLIKPGDPFFKLCYSNPPLVDRLVDYKAGGWAKFQVWQAIHRAYIQPAIGQAEKAGKEPDWAALENKLAQQYDTALAVTWVLDSRVRWYKNSQLDDKYLKYLPAQLAHHDLQKMVDVMSLNSGAWEVFLYSEDTALMEQALGWTNIAIGRTAGGIMEDMTKDTKAWLLYKLGRQNEALALMRSLAKNYPEGHHNRLAVETKISWMLQGEPAWIRLAIREKEMRSGKP